MRWRNHLMGLPHQGLEARTVDEEQWAGHGRTRTHHCKNCIRMGNCTACMDMEFWTGLKRVRKPQKLEHEPTPALGRDL